MMTVAVTATSSAFSCPLLLRSQGLNRPMQWKRNEKRRCSAKVTVPNVITAGFELKPPPYSLVLGWSIVEDEADMWKVRDFGCRVELINRIHKVAEASGQYPSLHLENPTQVQAELHTSSIGGLSMNDFILAAKIDDIKISDLSPRKRVWA